MSCQEAVVEPLRIVGLATHNGHGGAQSALGRLMTGLANRGHNAELWFLYRTRGQHQTTAPDARLLLPRHVQGALGYVEAALALRHALDEARPDALVSFLPLANVLGQTLAAVTGVPARVASQRNPGWTYNRPLPILDKIAGTAGIYGRIACVSAAVRQSFEQYPGAYRRRLVVVPNGLDGQGRRIEKAAARLAFGLPLDAFVVAAVGRLCAQKNLKLLLHALARTSSMLLVLAGDGEDRGMLVQQVRQLGIAERVLFLGKVAGGSVPDLLASADVFAQPSLYEGQSNALLEAMAAGLAIIASDVPSQREMLMDGAGGACGLLLPLDDPGMWASVLQRLHADVEERLELGRAASARSAAFTVERMVAGFEATIAAALAERKGIGEHWIREWRL